MRIHRLAVILCLCIPCVQRNNIIECQTSSIMSFHNQLGAGRAVCPVDNKQIHAGLDTRQQYILL